MIDIESLEEIEGNDEFDCPICLNRFPKNTENDQMKIECSSKKHDICNECMVKWIKESIERGKDVKCVICNETIYQFQVHLQRMRNLAEQERMAYRRREEEERRVSNMEEVSRSHLERNLHEITQSLKKFGCFTSVGFSFCFALYIFLPQNKQNYLMNFFIFYIFVILLILLGLYFNRLYYIFRLHQMNRIYPESVS